MKKGKCYACVHYFDCEFPNHSQRDLLWARHKDGAFWWGKMRGANPPGGEGNWVKICRWCRDALAMSD